MYFYRGKSCGKCIFTAENVRKMNFTAKKGAENQSGFADFSGVAQLHRFPGQASAPGDDFMNLNFCHKVFGQIYVV
jgi:hypothetical protein